MKLPKPDLSYAIEDDNILVNGYRISQRDKGLDSEIDSSYNQNHMAMIRHFDGDDSELPKAMNYIVPNTTGVFRRYNRDGKWATKMQLVDKITREDGTIQEVYVKVPNKAYNFLTEFSYFTDPMNLSKDNKFPTLLALSCYRQTKHVTSGILKMFTTNLSIMSIVLKILALFGLYSVSKSFEWYDVLSYIGLGQILLLGEAQNKTDTRGRFKTILGKKVTENEVFKYISIGDFILINHCSVLIRASIYSISSPLLRILGYVVCYPLILIADLFNLADMGIKVYQSGKETEKVHNGSEFGTMCRQYYMDKVCPTPLSKLSKKLYRKIRLGAVERCRLYFVDGYPQEDNGRVFGMQLYVEYLAHKLGLE